MLRFLCVSVPRFVLGTLILAGIAINFANVVGRYVFGAPIIWAEEILVSIMIWCVFLGAIQVTWEGQHIRMDLIAARIGPPWREIVNGLAAVTMVLVCLFVIRHSWTFVAMLYSTGQKSVVARLPAFASHGAILLGFCGMLFVVLVRLRAYLSGNFGELPDAGEGASGSDAGGDP